MPVDTAVPDNSSRRHLAAHNWGWFMLRGIVGVIFGILAIFMPVTALLAFTLVFAAYALIDGIASLVSGLRGASRHGGHWGALVFRGIIGIVVGLVFLFMPVLATLTYAFMAMVLIAAWAILTGILEIVTAIRLRKEMTGEWLLVLVGIGSIVFGIVIFSWIISYPLATIVSAAWILAIYAFCTGIILIAQSLRLHSHQPATAPPTVRE